nr:hypothetical protein [Nostoc sp. ChiSLP03a]
MNEIFRNKYFKHREINLASKTAKLRSLSFLQSKSQVFYTFWKNAIAIKLSLPFGQRSDFFLRRGQVGGQGRNQFKIQNSKFKIKELLPPASSFPMPNAQCPILTIY